MTSAALSGLPDKPRRRRTAGQIAVLEAQILDVLAVDHPQSVRHAFYRMTDPRLAEPVEKSEHGYAQVQDRIAKMRRCGKIPYGWITDATRMGWHTPAYGSAAEYLEAVAGLYRQNIWADTGWHVEVWVESRSIAGVLTGICRELGVSLYPCGGFASMTLAYEAAQHINAVCTARDKSPAILFVGDYDPAGVLIDQALLRELREHLVLELHFERLAINAEQIAAWDLPAKPRKATDSRRLDITRTVEAEAMPAGELRALVRRAIEAFLPERAIEVARIAEQEERRALAIVAEALAAGQR